MTTELAEKIAAASTAALVDTVIRLTHRIHDERAYPADFTVLTDLRTQRDLVKAELIRRAEGSE